jgi:hypothetical protein
MFTMIGKTFKKTVGLIHCPFSRWDTRGDMCDDAERIVSEIRELTQRVEQGNQILQKMREEIYQQLSAEKWYQNKWFMYALYFFGLIVVGRSVA